MLHHATPSTPNQTPNGVRLDCGRILFHADVLDCFGERGEA
jgi:hypothetical protein